MTWIRGWVWRLWRSSQTSAPTSEIFELYELGTMSPAWWRDQHRRSRVEFHGPSWTWPIQKDRNE